MQLYGRDGTVYLAMFTDLPDPSLLTTENDLKSLDMYLLMHLLPVRLFWGGKWNFVLAEAFSSLLLAVVIEAFLGGKFCQMPNSHV